MLEKKVCRKDLDVDCQVAKRLSDVTMLSHAANPIALLTTAIRCVDARHAANHTADTSSTNRSILPRALGIDALPH